MKKITIISIGYTTAHTIYKQLEKLFASNVVLDYRCKTISENINENNSLKKNLKTDLIIYSSNIAYREMHHLQPKEVPYIVVRRSINYHEINKLFKLSRDTDALLVNDSEESARETILLLYTLGIDHINFFPYYPGASSFPHLKTAITPGELEHIPSFVEKVIDIKTRLVDITSIVEILLKLDMPAKFANIISAEYIQDIIKLIKTSSKLLKNSSNMRKLFKTVINNVHDGLIAVDKENKVLVFNPVAEKMFEEKADMLLNKYLNQSFSYKLMETVENPRKEGMLKLVSKDIFVSETPLYEQNTNKGKLYVLKDVSEIHRLEESVRRRLYQEKNIARYHFDDIIGKSVAIKNAILLAKKMAKSEATVFIHGESGVGKELFAQSIHNHSQRKSGPFVAVNFAALSENLLESELFGYEEGSFTGAKRGGAIGLFEAAHKGTLFLDEIGDAPLPFQVKLLRILQEHQIRRVGSTKIIPIDVRVIVATNHDLKKHINMGLMREDLYYRLNVLPLKIPPLRKRCEDIIMLACAFYNKYKPLHNDAQEYFKFVRPYLEKYSWPGNIRELQNVVEYMTSIYPDKSPGVDALTEDMKYQLFSVENNAANAKEEIYAEIKLANENNKPVGRRSLAQKFSLPENKVRDILNELRDEGRICIARGKYGLKAV